MGIPVNEKINEALARMAWIAPVSEAAGTYLTTAFSMAQLEKVLFVLHVGAIAGGATVDAKVRWSATSGGTYADVPGAAIVQVTVTPTGPILIEVEAITLAAQSSLGDLPFLKLSITVGTAAVVLGVDVFGGPTCYSPSSDLSAVAPAQLIQV